MRLSALLAAALLALPSPGRSSLVKRDGLQYAVNSVPEDCALSADWGDDVEFHYETRRPGTNVGEGRRPGAPRGRGGPARAGPAGRRPTGTPRTLPPAVLDEGTRRVGRPMALHLSPPGAGGAVPVSLGGSAATPVASLAPGLAGMCLGERRRIWLADDRAGDLQVDVELVSVNAQVRRSDGAAA